MPPSDAWRLGTDIRKGINSAAFEAGTLVYKAGLEGVQTAVNQTRSGHVSFSSKRYDITNLYTGLLELRQNLNALQASNQVQFTNGTAQSRSVAATGHWNWTTDTKVKGTATDQTILLYTMDDILSVSIMQSLATLYSAVRLTGVIRSVSSLARRKTQFYRFHHHPNLFRQRAV